MNEPHNAESERAVLGSCLIDRDAILAVAPILVADDFQIRRHQTIYAAILDLYYAKVPADLVALVNKLASGGNLEDSGGELYLAELIDATPTSVHAEYYAGIVAEYAQRRRLIHAAQQIVRSGYDTSISVDDLVVQAESEIQQASENRSSGTTEPLGTALDRYVTSLDAGPRTFTTFGYRRLDDLLGGMEPGTVTIVAGRPSHGKTGFVFGTAMHVAGKLGKKALMVSLEMSNEQMVHRALAMRTGFDSRKLRARSFGAIEREIVSEAAEEIHAWPVEFSASWGAEITRVLNQIRSYHAARGIDVLIIDGLWLLEWSGAKGNRVQEVGKISRLLKLLAMDLNIPILLCHQLNRAMMARPDRTPMLNDLRESGDVEQDADVVIFVHRPGLVDDSGKTAKDFGQIIVAKNRQGPVGRIPMRFNEITTQFIDSTPREQYGLAAD